MNCYERMADALEKRAAVAKEEANKAAKIWARVADLSHEEFFMLNELLKDKLENND